jgi:hypothetical protein
MNQIMIPDGRAEAVPGFADLRTDLVNIDNTGTAVSSIDDDFAVHIIPLLFI